MPTWFVFGRNSKRIQVRHNIFLPSTLLDTAFHPSRCLLSDVDHSAGVLNEIPARAENRMTNAVNVPDGATRMHNAIIYSFVQLVLLGRLGGLPERRLIVGMNSLNELLHSGRTIARIKTQNAVT